MAEVSEEVKELAKERDKALNDDSQKDAEVEDWKEKDLRYKGKQIRENSSYNARKCIEHTPELNGLFKFNEFNRQVEKRRGVKEWGILPGQSYDDDVAVIDYHLEEKYNLVFPEKKVSQAMLVIAKENSFNPVKDWVEKKPWDGIKRAESLFIDTLGAEDNNYVRNVTHVFLLELVSRIYHPGAKCDVVPMLHSEKQGIGKSTVLRNLCPNDDTFDDSLLSLGMTKDDYGQIQGKLVVEIGELSAMNNTGIDRVKGFITSQSDKYREPYAKSSTSHPRTCVFAGTTNQSEFLTDRTGNRRFALIKCHGGDVKVSPFKKDNTAYYQQILAEAKTWFDAGEDPILSPEADLVAKEKANAAMIDDIEEENVINFFNMLIPECWHELTTYQKRDYYLNRNSHKFSSKLSGLIEKDDCKSNLEYFTTAECLSTVFNIDTTKGLPKEARRLQMKLSSIAADHGWEHTEINEPNLKGKGYKKVLS